jgi:hypothetical protein
VSFHSCEFLDKNKSVSVPFPTAGVVEIIDSLTEEFKMRVNNINSNSTNICSVLGNPFFVKVNVAGEK